MDFLPVFLNIKNKACLVVGGGEVATRKVMLLLQTGAHVSVVSPELSNALNELHAQGKIKHHAEFFQHGHLEDIVLVIAATNDRDTNRQVSAAAQQRQIPVNVVDDPELCTFIMPSIVDRSPLLIAISSGGQSPVLARLLRAQLETMIPAAYGRLAAMAGRFREHVKQHFTHPEKRRIFWEKTLQSRFSEMVLAGQDEAAQNYLLRSLQQEKDEPPQGEVYLVGAGPGNPDLLTFRAMRLMQQADVVVYDRLVSPAILDMVRRDAERIYAGKERNRHTLQQESINQLLVRLAQEGKRVLRLKGGDPFIFGRGGEEIETLAAHHIPFQVVPGITAASGVAAYAGIPLTHRDYAQSCIFVTGHLKNNSIDLDWPHLARPHQTIVIYMGLLGLSVLCQQLIAHGLPDSTPAAIIQQGTTQKQRIVTGTLQTLPDLAQTAHLTPPTLIIVGQVVKLHQNLAWFQPASDAENTKAHFLALDQLEKPSTE
ncbi:MAG: uroporphyrinogen-III C-methyltransferase [Nitrosomonas sp.]|nr:siroheme synthase CysG [Nitrosomonas sp.]OQW84265.1 MAG: uroporphyrinogen-III C-methyltransferase [Proteobacteria bacterium ST_bin16]TXI36908.1 MAG: uroporphyrinogen-III C-methyltransferase [Nitrosomonas sp.]